MIFRTINTYAKKSTEQFGLLNKSFRDIKKDFADDYAKEMLSQVKDLYDYEKSITQQTAEVSKYQKIINFIQRINDTEKGKNPTTPTLKLKTIM